MGLLRFASWVEWLQPQLSFKTTLTNMDIAHIQIWYSSKKQIWILHIYKYCIVQRNKCGYCTHMYTY